MSGEDDDANQDDAAVEARKATARRMGWKPRDEYKGDAARWTDYEEYIATGMQELPVLRERYRALDRRFDGVEKTLKETSDRLGETSEVLIQFRDHAAANEQRAYDRARKDLEAQRNAAVLDADPAKVAQVQADIEALPKPQPAPKKPDPAAKPDGVTGDEPPPEVKAWVDKNSWYRTNPIANGVAVGLHQAFKTTHPNLSIEENLEMVTDQMRELMPQVFENPRRKGAAPVGKPENSGGGDDTNNGGGQKGRTFDDLPEDAKAACNRFCKQMVKGKDGKMAPFMTQAKFLADYQWGN